jgi:crossover junction endodeoxyribonuclease RusA
MERVVKAVAEGQEAARLSARSAAAHVGRMELDVFVPSAAADMGSRAGSPAAQGSKKYAGHRRSRKTGKMAPLLLEQSRAVKPWREVVATVIRLHWRGRPLLTGGVGMRLEFVLPRPKGTSRTARLLATKQHHDVDKLCRAILDSLKKVVWIDDGQVVDLHATKRIAEVGERPGCRIVVWCVTGES